MPRARAAPSWPRWPDAMDESAITDWSFPGRGLIRGEALARYVREHTGGRHDRADGDCRWASSPPTSTAAQPILFQRRRHRASRCARRARCRRCSSRCASARASTSTAAWSSPVPVRFARQMGAELVIAVDISAAPDGNATGDAMRMLLQTFAIMGRSINSFELRDADVVLRPKLAGRVGAPTSPRASGRSRPGARPRWRRWPNCGRSSPRKTR